MYIIIAGAGIVGGELAQRLSDNKHDVVIIDKDEENCVRLYAKTGIVAINGNATQIDILQEAGIEKADVLVASMRDDVDNLACGILAKSFEVPKIIVRMRNPAYENAYRLAGVNSILRVADLLINEMVVEIEQPHVRRIITIGGGKGEIFMVIIPERARIAGRSVESIAKDNKFPSKAVFIAVYSRENTSISFPRGDNVISENDEVFLISPSEDIKKVADFLTMR